MLSTNTAFVTNYSTLQRRVRVSAGSAGNKSSVDPTVTLIVSTPSANKVNNCRGYQFNPGLDEGKSRERLACRLTDRHLRSPSVFPVSTTCEALGFVENRKESSVFPQLCPSYTQCFIVLFVGINLLKFVYLRLHFEMSGDVIKMGVVKQDLI